MHERRVFCSFALFRRLFFFRASILCLGDCIFAPLELMAIDMAPRALATWLQFNDFESTGASSAAEPRLRCIQRAEDGGTKCRRKH